MDRHIGSPADWIINTACGLLCFLRTDVVGLSIRFGDFPMRLIKEADDGIK